MTLEQMRYYCAACEFNNLSEAANRLFVSHSSISRAITAMESEFGVTLLQRTRHGIFITPAGTKCWHQCQSILAQIDNLKSELHHSMQAGVLRMGSIGGLSHKYFVLFSGFNRALPNVRAHYEYNSQWKLIQSLLDGDLDVCLAFTYDTYNICRLFPELEVLPVSRGSFKAVVSPLHPLASQREILLDDLLAHPDLISGNILHFLLTPPYTRQRYKTLTSEDELSVADLMFRLQTDNVILAVPEHIINVFGSDSVVLNIPDKNVQYELSIIYRRDYYNPVISEFLTYLKSVMANIDESAHPLPT